ncbi:hypothetical protein BB558_002942 [Smittium angustum]|uniref:Uncharacterized protein n=1 Tax=Smittium angustum TaxID=133377 RepID=A0A2U1J7F5_SMIAN|nr:hypothetical protein BB558_002942 [Smittium angustum]
MDKTTASLIRELTKKVDELLIERANARDPEEDQHITTRIPITDLNVYPELFEALPSIEEDFFRTPMTEEEKNEAIYTCPRTIAMNYQPPPFNNLASPVVKKAEIILYGIQVALAQATRPIDHYVHFRIQEDPKPTEDDPHIVLATTMRILLLDIATTVTQDRLDNLHKGMELPGKPHQLVESNIKPLMDPEVLEILLASKKTMKRSRSTADLPPTQIQAEIEPKSQQGINEGNSLTSSKASHKEIQPQTPGFYIQLFTIPKKTGDL